LRHLDRSCERRKRDYQKPKSMRIAETKRRPSRQKDHKMLKTMVCGTGAGRDLENPSHTTPPLVRAQIGPRIRARLVRLRRDLKESLDGRERQPPNLPDLMAQLASRILN
jgi:hypothetical protein